MEAQHRESGKKGKKFSVADYGELRYGKTAAGRMSVSPGSRFSDVTKTYGDYVKTISNIAITLDMADNKIQKE